MDSGKMFLCYVPKKHITDALIDQVDWLIENEYSNYNDCVIIDNISKGYRIYPNDLKAMMSRCSYSELLDNIYDNINKNKTSIILNDFDIDIDDLKDVYSEIIKEKNITIIIFNSIKTDNEDKLMIKIKKDLKELKEDKWSELKSEILEHIDEYMDRFDSNNEIFDPEEDSDDEGLQELLDLISKELSEECEEDEESYNRFALKSIKESYTYQKKQDVLSVSLTTGNDLILSDGEEQILIKNNMINHLLETIEHIRGKK